MPPDAHVPPFATRPYEPFSTQAVVAIALREWRLFGQPVDDDPPGTRPPPAPGDKPERQPGLWQRVGEYWWLGLNAGDPDSAWTGKHDASGRVFPATEDGEYAWSAAFVSYVMRIAGAGPYFPYAADHADYINAAARMAGNASTSWVVNAERPEAYAPQPGDLICTGRGAAGSLRFDDLPAGHFPAHCDIVVDTTVPGQVAVIGGKAGGPPATVTPCGRCRQVLNELAQLGGTDPVIWCAGGADVLELRLSDLLPHAFGPANLA